MKKTTDKKSDRIAATGAPRLPQAPAVQVATSAKSRRPLLIALLTIVLLTGIGFFNYQRYQANRQAEQAFQADKARFAQVEKDMAAAYALMTAEDKPVEQKMYRSCSYVAQKVGKGPLSCGVSYVFGYNEDYSNASNRLHRFINRLQVSQVYSPEINFQLEQAKGRNNSSVLNEQPITVNLKSVQYNMQCVLNLGTFLSDEGTFIGSEQGNNTQYNLRCSDNVRQAVYTVSEY